MTNNSRRPDVSYLCISRYPVALLGRFSSPQWVLRVSLVIAAIVLGGVLGLAAPQIDGGVALIWPPIGIALRNIKGLHHHPRRYRCVVPFAKLHSTKDDVLYVLYCVLFLHHGVNVVVAHRCSNHQGSVFGCALR